MLKFIKKSLIFTIGLFLISTLHTNGQVQNRLSYKEHRDSLRRDSLRLDSNKIDKNYIYSFILDGRDILVSPYYWNVKQWVLAGVTGGIVTGFILSGEDKRIQVFAQSHRNSTTNFLETKIGDPLGSGEYPAIILGLSYGAGLIFHKPHIGQFAKLATKSILLSETAVTLLKMISERDRPFQDNPANPLVWKGPIGEFGNTSFPSGHAAMAWSFATMVAMEYPHPLIIPILAYSAATVTSLGRINGNFHWSSDVIFSSVLCYSISRLVFRHNNWGNYKRQRMMRYSESNKI